MADILICEDDPLLALDLAICVEGLGHRVCGVFDRGLDAANAIGRLRPAAALVDLSLADGETGTEVALAAAQHDCRVIVISGANTVSAPLSASRHIFVNKPVPQEVMSELLAPLA